MAEETPIEVPEDEAGLAFRFEMTLKNYLLGYWPVLLGVVATVLVAVLIYGQYQSWHTGNQRKLTGETARVVADLPIPMPMQPLTDDQRQELIEGGEKLMALADEGRSVAQVEAYLRAAEAFRQADAPDKQRAALQKASEGAAGPLRYSALGGLANLDLEAGNADQAIERLRSLMQQEQGFEGEQAALDLGLVLEQLDRDEEAAQVYRDFQQRWPESARSEVVSERLSSLGAGGS